MATTSPHTQLNSYLRDASIELINTGKVDDFDFLGAVPPVITRLEVEASGPVDLAPLAGFPGLELVDLLGGEASTGWEVLPTLTALRRLTVNPPDGGRGMSFFSVLADCPSLTQVLLNGCTELSDLSALVSVSRLRNVAMHGAKCLRDLRALTGLPDLKWLYIGDAQLPGGLAAVAPVLNQLEELGVWSVSTATSFDALAGSSLQAVNLADCPATDLAPLATLQSLKRVWLRQFPTVNAAPLAGLPQLRELILTEIDEPVDLSPLAQTEHRLQVKLRDTSTVGTVGPLVKVRQL